jgi:exopolysaccharide biosynthesis polyprenyl glycosylphosphotransferase
VTNGTNGFTSTRGPLLSAAAAGIDERTLEIIEHRRRTAVVRRRGWLIRRMLLLADVVGLTVAFVVTQLLFPATASTAPFDRVEPGLEILLLLASLPAWAVVAKIYGLYDHDEERTDHTTIDDVVALVHAVTIGVWTVVAVAWLTGLAQPYFGKVLTFWVLAIALVIVARASARALSRRHIAYLQNTVIVGAGDVGQLVARKFLHHPEYGINLVGFVDSEANEHGHGLEHVTVLGPPEDLPRIVRAFDIERIIIAFSRDSHERTLDLIRSLHDLWIQVDIVPRLFELVSPSASIHTVEGLPLVGLPPVRLSRSSRMLKRAMDIAFSLAALLLLSPLLAVIALAIKVESAGPVLFRQVRMGTGNRPFRMYKFRTMVADAEERKGELAHLNRHARRDSDSRMFKIWNDPRTTRVGRFLRLASLDELPQLVNVLKGEMSLVGPRPLIPEEDSFVNGWARKRLDLKPGMTGLWQVLGRNEIPFDEMVKLDYLYVTSWSLWNDCRLLFRTIPLVLKGQGGRY